MSLIENLLYQKNHFKLHIPRWPLSDTKATALRGSVGSGKTTILKILCGLIPCKDLIWTFKGQNLAALLPPERHLGVCFQDLRLFPHFTAKKNILFALKAKNIPFSDRKKNFEEIIHLLDLEKCLNRSSESLSGGERQRVALARALIVRPRFLLLDEPFSCLDLESRRKARSLTHEFIKRYSIPLLIISHNREDIKGLTQEEFILRQGQVFKQTGHSPT